MYLHHHFSNRTIIYVCLQYHSGFRHQVQSWPSNPVSHYISQLSSYPQNTIIADLGCGDATLARGLLPKKLRVLSFDLISDGAYIVAADTCSHVPLPGSEPSSSQMSEGEAQVVDVVVCALSLMGTNWPVCIREAWRVLKPGYVLRCHIISSLLNSIQGGAENCGSCQSLYRRGRICIVN